MTDTTAGEGVYRKTATIKATQWFKMGDHPAVILKSAPNRYADEGVPWVDTLEGGHVVTPGDWIATGVQGEHWPIKPDVFAATYALAAQPSAGAQGEAVAPIEIDHPHRPSMTVKERTYLAQNVRRWGLESALVDSLCTSAMANPGQGSFAGYLWAIAEQVKGLLAARATPAQPPAHPVDIVPSHCTGALLSFEPGVLHVSKDGSGYIAIDERHFSLEEDRCDGPDGPEGSVHWITRMDASEMVALRDFLNGSAATPAQPDTGDVAALREALKWLEWARPKAVSAMEDHRCLRVKSGHNMKGTYRSGTTYVGLYQSEVDEIEESADFIVSLRNRLAALSKPNAQGEGG